MKIAASATGINCIGQLETHSVTLTLSMERKSWAMREPMEISRGVLTETNTLVITLTDRQGLRGRGEGCGVDYAGETLQSMSDQVDQVRSAVERGASRADLLGLLPPGGARCAIDAALWDLEAKQCGRSAFELAGLESPAPAITAYTIGMRPALAYEAAASERSAYALLKLKVGRGDPIPAVEAARRGAPAAAFIVDPNQAWEVSTLRQVAPRLRDLGVVLLEQPIKVGDEPGLDGYRCPIPLCADELVNSSADLQKARGRFDVINIKLDKAGGLTEGLRMARAARAMGFELMAGCMFGSSLAMAPAMVLAQQCTFVDLDGPLVQSEDWPDGLTYKDGVVNPPRQDFWG